MKSIAKRLHGPMLALAYVATGKLGLMLALPPGYASGVFPAAGMSVAAAYLWGRRTYPWIFLGSFMLNLWVGHFALDTLAIAAAAAIALASTVQAWAGGVLLRRAIGPDASLDKGAQIGRYLLAAPLICLVSATLSMTCLHALGLVAADKLLEAWSTWWIGDTLGVVAFFSVMQAFFGRPAADWRKRRPIVVTTVTVSFALVVLAYVKSSQIEMGKITQTFQFEAGRIGVQLQDQFDDQAYLLDQLETFFSKASSDVTRDEFRAFVQPALRRFPSLQAIEWVPRVAHDERQAFELGQQGAFPRFQIRQRDASGSLVPANQRSTYYPVTYLEPVRGNEHAVGFDLASDPARAAAVLQTERTGRPVATESITLVQENGEQTGLLLLQKVDSQRAPGLVLTVLRMGDFISKFVPAGAGMDVTLVDRQLGETLYGEAGEQQAVTEFTQDMQFGGREYQLRITPTAQYLDAHHSLQSWAMLVVGTLGTGLLGALMLLTTGTTARVEKMVDERTADLVRLNRVLNETQFAMNRAGIGIQAEDFASDRILYVNQCMAEMLGYTSEEMLGMHATDFGCDDTPEEHAERRRQLRRDGRLQFEEHRRTRSGVEIPVEVIAYLQEGGEEQSARVITFVTDISDRKQAEEALIQAKLAAEDASIAKSIFLANMSHEIRTPMNGVMGMCDVLLHTPLSDDQRRMAAVIRDSAQAQLGILNDILDFSKIEAGKMDLSNEPFALAEVIGKICDTLAEHAHKDSVSLSSQVDPKIPAVLEGDALRVRQIMINFASNAIKFSSGLAHPGVVAVAARLAGEDDDRIWVDLSVSDNGIGMDEATQARIFHPFTQADASTTRKYGGTGLGLVICARLAEAMGGVLRVRSRPGDGSTFTAHLPFARAGDCRVAPDRDLGQPPMPGGAPGRDVAIRQGRLILVVEDNETNQEVIRHQLDMLGYCCDVAADGRQAFSQWLGGSYGLVLSDIHMPYMDGYQLAEAIRQEEAKQGRARTPILALTANALKGEAERCQAAGMDGYLGKPVALSQLVEQLARCLPVATPAAAAAASPAPSPAERAGGASAVFDPDMLTQLVGDNPAIHRRLRERFLANAQLQAARLRAAITAGDARAAGHIAHGLKSNARAVGAMQLGDLCEALEHVGKTGDLGALEARLATFEAAFESANHALGGLHPDE
ncbi:MAG: CHASE domain-containing protein [Zoogloeaceae bacterium]|nr:CHASE domain-containing protein [Rhodocyclaceae bacterium]MCP5235629.1 CHASE domain-containing protein [Zoogloeaceae bacterium]